MDYLHLSYVLNFLYTTSAHTSYFAVHYSRPNYSKHLGSYDLMALFTNMLIIIIIVITVNI